MIDPSSKLAFIQSTKTTPRVLLDAKRKLIDIRGRAIFGEESNLFDAIQKWIKTNLNEIENGLVINANFEYFNTHCSKKILDLFKLTEKLAKKSNQVSVNWGFEDGDEDMHEAGEDYAAIVSTPFKFIKYEDWNETDETYYENTQAIDKDSKTLILDINTELLKYIAKNPDYIYKISSRKFEELVADIIKDFGFDVELTKISRDGGRDIVANIKNSLTSMLMFIECKHYAPNRPVGVDIVRQVIGVKELYKPNKSLIVTSSYFTKDAIKERNSLESQLDLKDHTDIKTWLNKYR